MHRYKVILAQEIDADSAEEAALLMFQSLTNSPPPLAYQVVDERDSAVTVELERPKAEEFASLDNTADPGNW